MEFTADKGVWEIKRPLSVVTNFLISIDTLGAVSNQSTVLFNLA